MSKLVGVGVTGGIAAYKIADLVSQLSKLDDIEVAVIMTEAATHFITPLTFRTLSNREVAVDLWQESSDHRVQHIGLAQSLDLFVVAPATANIIGKMGYAIARAAQKRGAEVILISGPSTLPAPAGVTYESVWSADEMCERMLSYQDRCDVIIGAAAIGDFKVANAAQQKMKKSDNASPTLILELIENPDILKTLGQRKKTGQIMVGFAAETNNLIEYAMKKLESKNLDFIVANDVTMEGAGFAIDTNIVTIITRDGETSPYPQMSKDDVAEIILDKVAELNGINR